MITGNLSDKVKKYINEMPSLPVSTEKVLELCNNINVSPFDLNKVISLDPVLTGRMLHLINSAYYGLGTHISSLVKAITMLGLNTVKNLVLSAAVLGVLQKKKGADGLNMDGFWHHCLCVGVTSKLLAAKRGVDPKNLEEYFTAGLLHDLGKIPLNAVLSSEYIHMITAADRDHKPLFLIEKSVMDIDHCIAGEMVAGIWKLNDSIKDVITWHHDITGYSGENINIVCNVAIANYFSIIYDVGFAGDRKPLKPEKKVWDTIGLDDNVFLEIMEKLYQEIERAKVFLKT